MRQVYRDGFCLCFLQEGDTKKDLMYKKFTEEMPMKDKGGREAGGDGI